MGESHEFLGVESDGAVARIVLKRPPLNILHREMIRELRSALGALRSEPALRVLVLAAEGKAFSAGVAVEDHLPDRVRPMIEAFHGVFREMRRLGCPTLAAVQGPALGGGCELACAADVVVASETARLGQPEIQLGVFPPIAALLFPHRIGAARTLRLILSGEVLSAREAEAIGLVDRVVPAEGLSEAVGELVARFREKSAPALRLAKRAVLAAAGRGFDEGLEHVERLFLDELMATRDATEGLRAFLEKRPAVWEHR
jgi:cyclohexa-1,5-dienecarbonyl-CoA hydratase